MATRNFVPRANNEGGIGTSVKQWASGFFQKLAVGAITTAVTVLTPSDDANNQQPATTGWVRSQFQSILKTVLTAAGLKYNIATNGYICFGSLFGNLILQWGYSITEGDSSYMQLTIPITATALLFGSACTDSSVFLSISPIKILSNKIELVKLEGVDTPARAGVGFRWFIICY